MALDVQAAAEAVRFSGGLFSGELRSNLNDRLRVSERMKAETTKVEDKTSPVSSDTEEPK